MDIELTKDSDYLICKLYESYLEKRSQQVPKYNAKIMGSSQNIQETVFPKWSCEDVDETCRELDRAGLLQCHYADNSVYTSILSDKGIIYMEHRFKNNINSILEYISKIKDCIPFI